MNSSALITMVITMATVTILTLYFFIKMLTTPPKSEPDSYSEEPGNLSQTPFNKNEKD